MPRPAQVLRVSGLAFAWPSAPVFTDLHLELPEGLGLVHGDEGCGKTSLLRLLAGDLRPSSGEIRLFGEPHTAESLKHQVFRTEPRSESLDAISASAWWASLADADARFDAAALPDLVLGFGLAPHTDKPLYMLSAGSKRKVWLCAALVNGRPLTLIDEPLAALDAPSTRFLVERLNLAGQQAGRAWLLADYEAPPGLRLMHTFAL
jgi:ABC-type transport system involved in cytochrome c biogenesis ATPase subunit